MKRKRYKRKSQTKILVVSLAILVILVSACIVVLFLIRHGTASTDKLLVTYMHYIGDKKYEKMYEMIDVQTSGNITQKDFVARNSAIYEGIEIQNMQVKIIEYDGKTVRYETSFDTLAGNVKFENEATFTNTKEGKKLVWMDSLIFPGLNQEDKVRVSTDEAERGQILDRNEKVLAGKGTVSSVGIVPGKLENKDQAIQQIAELLDITADTIKEKLEASWVTEDSFVPIQTIPKVEEIDLLSPDPDEEVLNEKARQDQLLNIPGVMLSDKEVREYPLGKAAAHLIGYVQSVTAEDLEKHAGEGYRTDSVIGKSGMEGLYESELKGKDGYKICIVDPEGNEKETIAESVKEDGQNIRLTIDAEVQKSLYDQFQDDPGCSVAMNPYTGEVLALVSTPSYDNNEFILGISNETWTALNEDENQPLYNRFRQIWCPGSTFKPVVASIGLETGILDASEDFGNEGLSWQKDASWGSYQVTTLHEYEPVILKNALIYSDNIYFAKAALKIGADQLTESLDGIGFNEKIPFEISMSESQYSNTDRIETEIQLADSGYGQGEILVNPLHLASIYTSFLNNGNMIQPYLQYNANPTGKTWIEGAFSADTVAQVMEGLTGVINDPNGTGYAAHRDDILLAGKTGTAELKDSQEDTTGTEIGWFAVFTADQNIENPILLISMVENVKGIGGSGYVVEKDRAVLDEYFSE